MFNIGMPLHFFDSILQHIANSEHRPTLLQTRTVLLGSFFPVDPIQWVDT